MAGDRRLPGGEGLTREEALGLLGLDATATWSEVRAAFRASVRRVHPDVAGGDSGDAARLTEAYALLERGWVEPSPSPPPPPPQPSPPPDPPDQIVLQAPPGEVFDRMHEASHRIGEVSYRDRESGILQVLVEGLNGLPCQLMIELHHDGDRTLAQFTLESMSQLPAPPIEAVVRRLARELRTIP